MPALRVMPNCIPLAVEVQLQQRGLALLPLCMVTTVPLLTKRHVQHHKPIGIFHTQKKTW